MGVMITKLVKHAILIKDPGQDISWTGLDSSSVRPRRLREIFRTISRVPRRSSCRLSTRRETTSVFPMTWCSTGTKQVSSWFRPASGQWRPEVPSKLGWLAWTTKGKSPFWWPRRFLANSCLLKCYTQAKQTGAMPRSCFQMTGTCCTVTTTGATKPQCCDLSTRFSFRTWTHAVVVWVVPVNLHFAFLTSSRTKSLLQKLAANNIEHVFVPASCTGLLQPNDLNINNVFKTAMMNRFTQWYARCVQEVVEKGQSVADVKIDLRASVMKPVHAAWLIEVYADLENSRDTIRIGYTLAGIVWRYQINFLRWAEFRLMALFTLGNFPYHIHICV